MKLGRHLLGSLATFLITYWLVDGFYRALEAVTWRRAFEREVSRAGYALARECRYRLELSRPLERPRRRSMFGRRCSG